MYGSKRARRTLWSVFFFGLLITTFAAESNTTIVTAASIGAKNVLEGVVIHVADAAGSQVIEDRSGYRYCLVGADDEIRHTLEAQAFAEYSRRVASVYMRSPDSVDRLNHITRVQGEASSFGGCADPATGADLQIFLVHAILSEQKEAPNRMVASGADGEVRRVPATRPRGAALLRNRCPATNGSPTI
ncbi:MAG: hypothetical protein HC802_15105 [Caldilineaceae bacterium]|nr:hypothetical protein [Caldilineaceae bacterium]